MSGSIPPNPREGTNIYQWAAELTRWLKGDRAVPGAGLTSTQTGSGRTFNAKPGVFGTLHPWKIIITGDDKVKIVYASVNFKVPEIGGVELDPDLSESPELTVTTSGNFRRIILKITIDDTTLALESAEIIEDGGFLLPQDTDTVGHFQIGVVTISDGKIASVSQQNLRANVTYAYAGGTVHYLFNGSI